MLAHLFSLVFPTSFLLLVLKGSCKSLALSGAMPGPFGGNEMKEPGFHQGSSNSCVVKTIFKSCTLVICLNWRGSKNFSLGTCISRVLMAVLFDSARCHCVGGQQLSEKNSLNDMNMCNIMVFLSREEQ